ncbi:hypothetical protein DL98DRAFT_661265 [Cadophora sp. DSE1049]|nr:hypothetical protein DL98DRAFT_661265 [Cadophora sp. DSE1049]
MATPRVLIFGGNGGIGRLMTGFMLKKSWHVTSVIRDSRQEAGILLLGPESGPKADVLVVDLAQMRNEDANNIITRVKPNYVVFTAGSISNPNAVDRDAAKKVIKASTTSLHVTKFLMISFPASRRNKAPWWNETDYANYLDETRAYPEIARAKLDADEYLVAMAKQRNDRCPNSFQATSLRPSWLTDSSDCKVHLGRTQFSGRVSRTAVAAVVVGLLERDTKGWFDLVEGSDDVESAVAKAVRDGVNCVEGEDLEQMYARAR